MTTTLDSLVRQVSADISEHLSVIERNYTDGLPAGGSWWHQGTCAALFEAIDCEENSAWYMNNYQFRMVMNPNVSHVTFASGTESIPGGAIETSLAMGHPEGQTTGYNVFYEGANSYYYREEGWTYQELYDIMLNILEQICGL